jgi:hypothetical protein
MRSNSADRHSERISNLLVAALLLMIKDKDGPLHLAQALELLFDRLLKLALLYLLLSVAVGVRKTVLPAGGLVRQRDVCVAVAAAALPLVLRHINGDAVEIGGDQRIAAKARQRAVEAEKDILGKIIKVFAAPRKAQKGAEDHLLMVLDHLLEGEIGVQAGLDHRVLLKFHSGY